MLFHYMSNVESSGSHRAPLDFKLISYLNKYRMHCIREGDLKEIIIVFKCLMFFAGEWERDFPMF